jgi:ParB family transcriptional regulator, chromosome partitioning protein
MNNNVIDLKKSEISASFDRLIEETKQSELAKDAELERKLSQTRKLMHVDIDKINDNKNHPRKYLQKESIDQLAASIQEKGILQPIIVSEDESGNIHLVAGKRRFLAAKKVGLKKLPVIIVDNNNSLDIALIENLEQENLKSIELAEALRDLKEKHNYTDEQLGEILGKGRSTVTEILSLNKLPEEAKEMCRLADLPRKELVKIVAMNIIDFEKQEKCRQLYLKTVFGSTKGERFTSHRYPEVVANDRMSSLLKLLNKIKFTELEEDKRKDLLMKWNELKKLMENLIKG